MSRTTKISLPLDRVDQVDTKLSEADLLTRSYANNEAPIAARLLWRHLCTLSGYHLDRWANLTVGQLANLASLDGERMFPGHEPLRQEPEPTPKHDPFPELTDYERDHADGWEPNS